MVARIENSNVPPCRKKSEWEYGRERIRLSTYPHLSYQYWPTKLNIILLYVIFSIASFKRSVCRTIHFNQQSAEGRKRSNGERLLYCRHTENGLLYFHSHSQFFFFFFFFFSNLFFCCVFSSLVSKSIFLLIDLPQIRDKTLDIKSDAFFLPDWSTNQPRDREHSLIEGRVDFGEKGENRFPKSLWRINQA